MLVKTFGSAVYGVEAITITIEVSVTAGLHTFVVGLPDVAIKESIQRVESAIKSNGYWMPRTKLVINLAPAGIKKSGSAFDLPIAMGVLGATEQIPGPERLKEFVIMGELGLDGDIYPIRGALPIAMRARSEQFTGLILPGQNAKEASLIDNLTIHPVRHLNEVIDLFKNNFSPVKSIHTAGNPAISELSSTSENRASPGSATETSPSAGITRSSVLSKDRQTPTRKPGTQHPDFKDVKGQEGIKRALEITAAGGHNTILIGPPGSGKTMLAKRLPGILPPLNLAEALETTMVYSVAGKLENDSDLMVERPFRAPHHTISSIALAGGSSNPQPGEISLAHNGVLFLDEFPEFNRLVLEVLRQPMEQGMVTISRAKMSVDYPARFILLAAMNPCPCGYYNHPEKPCVCPPGMVRKYLNKISGPLLDRIDLHIEVVPVPYSQLTVNQSGEPSSVVRDRVIEARNRQAWRFRRITGDASDTRGRPVCKDYPGSAGWSDTMNSDSSLQYCNSRISGQMVETICKLDRQGNKLLQEAMTRLHLSARAYDRILKVGRSIADLSGTEMIRPEHLAEAIQYRSLDRTNWAG